MYLEDGAPLSHRDRSSYALLHYVSLWLAVHLCCSVASVMPDSVDYNPPGSSVHRILQARILEWVALPSSRGSSPPRDGTQVSYISCIGRRVLNH